MKKILALVIAALLALSMVSAFAATVSIEGQTTDSPINGHTFKAYQVLSGNWEGGKLTNQGNGDGVDWSDAMLNALNAIDGISGVTNGKTLAAALDGKDVALGEKVAKVLQEYVVTANAITVTDGSTLNDGYYIIIDETTLGNNEVANAALLQVAGDAVAIAVKTSTTTVDKKIDGSSDADSATTGLVESNNGQIGDLVPYVITATIADTTYYDKYYFEMNDTVSSGLTISASDATGDAAFSNYKVYDNNAEITEGFVLTVNPTAGTIQLKIQDAKALGGHTIKLTYNAKINENAVVGVEGNPNTVTLKYTNSPDHSGEGEYDKDNYTSTTPEQKVLTFLTSIELLKVDKAHPEKVLPGAVFRISGTKNVSTVVTTHGFTAADDGEYYKLVDGTYTKSAPGTVAALTDDKYVQPVERYNATDTTETKTQTSSVNVEGTTGNDGFLKFDDLGAGDYTITEITAPTGYNLLSAPITFTISCTTPTTVTTGSETCSWAVSAVTGGNVTQDNGVFKITVEDAQGQSLPSTGGMGTTLLYVGGSILVLAAVILLVTKRRMNAED